MKDKENKKYLNCKYLDAGMDGMLCSKSLCTTCKEFNGGKCKDYISKDNPSKKEKQVEKMAKAMQKCYEKNGLLNFKWFAESAYKCLTEDSVVVTREEYNEYIELRTSEVAELVKENKALGKQCLDWMKLYHSQLNKTSQISKEAAEKILNEVSKHYGGAWLVELYKKFGVEIKE